LIKIYKISFDKICFWLKIKKQDLLCLFVCFMNLKGTNILKQIISNIKNKICSSSLYWIHLIIFFLIAFTVKIWIVYFSNKNLDSVKICLSYISSDIIVLFVVQLIITINSFLKNRILRLFNNVIVLIILLVYCVDIFTIFFFQSRVSIMEAYMVWNNWTSGFLLEALVSIGLFIIILVISIVLSKSMSSEDKCMTKKMLLILSVFLLCYADFYRILATFGVGTYYVENIFDLNFGSITDSQRILDDSSLHEDNLSYEDYISFVQWNGKDLNLILVFAESLSAIDSANLWWSDEIPYFDKIQKDWITFTNFITNWTTSDTAHISALYGVIPLINMWANNTPYSGYKLLMKPLPEYLNTQWYHTTFVSAASLDFMNQREFLSWAWFQTIIWEEAFTGSKKYSFESAPDWDLYDKVLQEIQWQTGKYFIWLQTISFHRPYNTPRGKTEALALKYSDEELYRFYQELQKIWFFENWILVILWDHRKMNPAEEWERELFWNNWYTRSVATIVWSWVEPWLMNSNIIQHTDFYNSLKMLLWHWPVKIDKTYNDIFSGNVRRSWWITNAEFYEINRYTVSSTNEEPFLFRNISNLSWKNDEVYNYFSSYLWFEFWNDGKYNLDAEDDSMKLIWHRWDISSSPENTLESFLSAKEQGAAWIEFDVSYTKDKKNIVVHGENLYASNCTKIKVWKYALNWITKNCTIVNWEKYKPLDEMLEMVDGLFNYYFLEIKVYNEELWAQQTKDVIQTVKDLNMQDRVIFISYSNAAREVLNSDPDIIFWWDTFDMDDLNIIWENNSKYFLAPYDLLTSEIVDKAKSLWKEVVTYTVNDVKNYQNMKDLWISMIMTDRLALLQDYDNNEYYPLKHNFKNINLRKSSR